MDAARCRYEPRGVAAVSSPPQPPATETSEASQYDAPSATRAFEEPEGQAVSLVKPSASKRSSPARSDSPRSESVSTALLQPSRMCTPASAPKDAMRHASSGSASNDLQV